MQWLALSQIKSSNVARRLQAIESLTHGNDLKALLALIAALSDSVPRVRVAAAQAIAFRRDERCVQPLLALLQDPNARVREAGIVALKAIGHPSAMPYIQPLLRDAAANVRVHAAHALKSLGWDGDSDELRVLFFIAAGQFTRAAEVGAAAIEPLLALLAEDSGAHRRAITEALGEISDPRAMEAIAAQLEDPDSGVRLVALHALGRTQDAAYAPAVMKLIDQPDKNLRAAAIEALVKMNCPDLFLILVNALNDEHWNVRAVAASALGKTGDGRAVEPLLQMLREADGEVRQVVAEAIGHLGDPNAIEGLILAQLDPDSRVRQSVSAALHRINPNWARLEPAQRTLPALKKALRHEDCGVRQTAAELLDQIFNIRQCEPRLAADVDAETARRQQAVDVLASILWDDDPLVRFAGVWALHQIGEPRAAGPVSTKVKDSDECVRRLAGKALVAFGVNEDARSQNEYAVETAADWGGNPAS